jgi:hypothetical protein
MIPPAKTNQTPFSVSTQYPNLPNMASLIPQDKKALEEWWMQVKQVLNRNNAALSAEIDTKQNNP